MTEEEFNKKIEGQKYFLCAKMRQELIDRKIKRAYTWYAANRTGKQDYQAQALKK